MRCVVPSISVNFAVGLALATTAVAALNLTQFVSIEQAAGQYYRALHAYGNTELIEIVEGHMGTTQDIFLMYLELGAVTDRPTVTMYPKAPLNELDLAAFGEAGQIVEAQYDPSIHLKLADTLRGKANSDGQQRDLGHYVIVAEGGRVEGRTDDSLLLLRHGEVFYIVDEDILPSAALEDIIDG